MQFNERLKLVRKNKGLTQKQTAEMCGMVLQQYQKYENGTNDPSIKVLAKLCKVLNVSADYLLNL